MAGTDRSRPTVSAPSPTVILCEPQLGENIGATARAMANFGLWDLRLVRPRGGWPNERAIAAASRADHVLEKVQVFDTLEAAVADLTLVFATTARRRELSQEVTGPDEAARRMASRIAAGGRAGVVFGRERWGLNNEEVALANAIVTLPVETGFASLNLAQAVLVISYEWRRQSVAGAKLPFQTTLGAIATKEEMLGMFVQLEDALDRAGFFKSQDKRPSMVNNLRTMFDRNVFTSQEIRTLRGVIAAIDRRHERSYPGRGPGRKGRQQGKSPGGNAT